MKNKSWKSFIESRETPIGLRVPDVKEPDVEKSSGVRIDDTPVSDPKEYTKLKKFLDGTNKPDPIPKNRWFVVDESSGHVWMNQTWVNPANMENMLDLDDAILKSENAATVLASVVHGVPVSAEECIVEDMNEWGDVIRKVLTNVGKKFKRAIGLRPSPTEDPDYYKPQGQATRPSKGHTLGSEGPGFTGSDWDHRR